MTNTTTSNYAIHIQAPAQVHGDMESTKTPNNGARRNAAMETILGQLLQHMNRNQEEAKAFICTSDLTAIWVHHRYEFDILFHNRPLNERQADALLRTNENQLLQFLSFLIWIRLPVEWFSTFRDNVFKRQDSDVLVEQLAKPDAMPLSVDFLISIGVVPVLAAKEHSAQFRFIPATIIMKHSEFVQEIRDAHVRLPFVKEDKRVVHGGYGVVEFCTIPKEYVLVEQHDSEGNFERRSKPYLAAVKTFRTGEDPRQSSEREVKNLNVLKESLNRNEHIAFHDSIIEHGPDFYIIFAQAKLGDLEQFLRGGYSLGPDRKPIQEYVFAEHFPAAAKQYPDAADRFFDLAPALLKQCWALSVALKFLHEDIRVPREGHVICAHMDLKPSNILIFGGHSSCPVGTWKISDFGISVFRKRARVVSVGDLFERRTLNTRARLDVSTYVAPEIERAFEQGQSVFQTDIEGKGSVGRRTDTWSFGAIFAEVLAFALDRECGVDAFRRKRLENSSRLVANDRFYSPDNSALHVGSTAFVVRPSVIKWLDKVSEIHSTHGSIRCWAKAVKEILKVVPNDRPAPVELENMIEHVADHVADQVNYEIGGPESRCKHLPPTTEPSKSESSIIRSSQYEYGHLPTPSINVEISLGHGSEGRISSSSHRGSSMDSVAPFPPDLGDPPTPSSSTNSSAQGVKTNHTRTGSQSTNRSQSILRLRNNQERPQSPLVLSNTKKRGEVQTRDIGLSAIPGGVAVDSQNIVFLIKSKDGSYEIHVSTIQPSYTSGDILGSSYRMRLPADKDHDKDFLWLGVAVSNWVIVCWGRHLRTGRSKVCIPCSSSGFSRAYYCLTPPFLQPTRLVFKSIPFFFKVISFS